MKKIAAIVEWFIIMTVCSVVGTILGWYLVIFVQEVIEQW